MDASRDRILVLFGKCKEYELEGCDEVEGRLVDGLVRMMEPMESAPDVLKPALLIYAVDLEHSDGRLSTFCDKNMRLRENGFKIAKARYRWFDPRRYLTMLDAMRLSFMLNGFGWEMWCAKGDINKMRNRL